MIFRLDQLRANIFDQMVIFKYFIFLYIGSTGLRLPYQLSLVFQTGLIMRKTDKQNKRKNTVFKTSPLKGWNFRSSYLLFNEQKKKMRKRERERERSNKEATIYSWKNQKREKTNKISKFWICFTFSHPNWKKGLLQKKWTPTIFRFEIPKSGEFSIVSLIKKIEKVWTPNKPLNNWPLQHYCILLEWL